MEHKEAEADEIVIPLLSVVRWECCTLSASILGMFLPSSVLMDVGPAAAFNPSVPKKSEKSCGKITKKK